MDDVETAELTAKQKLRAFEDETFGKDCVRISGEIERGYGSPFKKMKPEQARHHAALEHLVTAEKHLSDASAAVAAANIAHDDALAKAEASKVTAAVVEFDGDKSE